MALTPCPPGPDRLIEELQRCEEQLQAWLESSTVNTLWFLVDPIDALRAANLGLTEETLFELGKTIKSLTEKLAQSAPEGATESAMQHATGDMPWHEMKA